MNQKQVVMRDFLEIIALDNLDYDKFEMAQKRMMASDDDIEEFCNFFELGADFAEKMDLIDFPFSKWWDGFCQEFEEMAEENSDNDAELYDDYLRMVGAK